MTAPITDPSVTRFASGDWPEAQRLAAVMDIYARGIMRYELAPSPDTPLHVEAAFHHLPELGLARVSASAASAHRARHHLSGDELVLNVGLSGMRSIRQCGREAVTGEGEAVLTTGAEIASATISTSQFMTFRVPAKLMAALVPNVHECLVRPIPRNTAPLRLLIGYAGGLQHPGTLATPALRRLATTYVHDLVALTLGATRDAAATARLRGARAARLQAIKTDIRQNLAKDLSVAALAARHRLPVRSLQRLFDTDGVTFTEFVLAERLIRAHKLLRDIAHAGQPISTIAFDCGFEHISYFNRVFRARFGLSPSDVRAQAGDAI